MSASDPNHSAPAAPASASAWRPLQFAGGEIEVIGAEHARPILPGFDLWDCWPLAHEDGRTVEQNGRCFWFFLSAPCLPDPILRHDVARIRLLSHGADGWRDHGNAMPDGFSPGAREWAGSAVRHANNRSVSLFFTAAGRRAEAPSVEQRLFVARGVMTSDGPGGWSAVDEVVRPDGQRYVVPQGPAGEPGTIKGFRDPAWFRDPATGLAHILFTGSAGWSDHAFNGLVGLATQRNGQWHLDDPLIEAVGVNNEMERPHVVHAGGLYYLFWSTQTHTFAPGTPAGPNGLYAMVAERLAGPWRPVNQGGLVAGNPAAEPGQSYSWWVTGEGAVWSFIDYWGMAGRRLGDDPALLRGQFGGTPAPVFRLAFAGDAVIIVG